jgi:UDP:flavonoid glycosyltransferase YjiC (YdhE family)
MRGDTQPLVALGAGLAAAGLAVSVATTADFIPAVRAADLAPYPLRGNGAAFFGGAAGVSMRERLADARAFRRLFDTYLQRFYAELLQDVTTACQGAAAIICWPWTRFATSLAEALRVPVFIACPYPPLHLPTAEFANPFQVPPLAGDPAAIRRSWRLAYPALQMGDAVLNRWRRDTLSLPPIGWREDLRRLRRLPHLLGFSTAVLPRPRDWAPWIDVSGFWLVNDDAYEPPADLVTFLANGPPPVAVGFSSQVARDASAFSREVVTGLAQAGVRGVLLAGLGGLARVERTASLFPVASVPHAWLYPRVAAVVHHGGSGSTAQAVRSGVPNMAVPFGYDQHLWGARLAALGVGPPALPADSLTAPALAVALRQLTTDRSMLRSARDLAATIRLEDGVGRAVETVLAAITRAAGEAPPTAEA